MSAPVIGFIGFGEAANLIAEGLKQEGVKSIHAFDVNTNHEHFGVSIRERAKNLQIPLYDTMADLLENCDIIFCATSAKVAEAIAKAARLHLNNNKLYIDINATSPMTKERVAACVEESGALFCDAAVMESVPLKKHRVPMLVSGSGATRFQEFGQQFGMDLTYIGEKAGNSSAIKMFRSVFMKGFTMLLLETLQASEKYGVTEHIVNSLENTIQSMKLEDMANMLINRTVIHADRRVAEMDEVIQTLQSLHVNSLMSQSTKQKLSRLVELNIQENLDNVVPQHYLEVLKQLDEFV